jgi:cytochrome c-type biogenesis protein CcmH/NrfG
VLASYPKQARIWMSYGHALKTAGHAARAIDAYRHALALASSSTTSTAIPSGR